MQLIKQRIERDGSGTVTLKPEESEDMVNPHALNRERCPTKPHPPQWYAYNLIQPSDLLYASAIRRVHTETATGTTASNRVHINLLIRVRSLDFDPQASALHINGQIVNETPHTRVGQYHTLDLELHRNFTLEKGEGWDSVSKEVVKEACASGAKRVGAWAVVMQEGKAAMVGLGAERTIVKGRVEVQVPGKSRSGHAKGSERFFQMTMDMLLKHVDLAESLPILLASPGFTAAAFLKFVNETAVRTGNKAMMGQKANFLVVHSSSGHVHALNEVLQSPEVQARLKDTRYARETKLMDEFMTLLRKDDGRAWYGPKEVERAVEKGAVGRGGGVLLISNGLFRAQDVAIRRRWVTLVDKVKDGEGGEVRVLSSEHESGRRLEGLGGIAAILTFPLEDLDEDEEGEAVADGTQDIDGQTTQI